MSEANEDLSYVEISCIHTEIDLESNFLINLLADFGASWLDGGKGRLGRKSPARRARVRARLSARPSALV